MTVLSLFPIYFAGIGLFVWSLFPGAIKAMSAPGADRPRFLALSLLLGISVNHATVLVVEDIRTSLIIGTILSMIGVVRAMHSFDKSFFGIFRIGWIPGAIIIYMLALYLVPILFEPLQSWDARSIWFLQGKMIYYNQALSRDAVWYKPAVEPSW